MTSIVFDHGTGSTGRLFDTVRRSAGAIVAAWRRHQAEQELEGLPFDLLKDIGYPSADVAGTNKTSRATR